MSNRLRKLICEMIIKIYNSEEVDSLEQLTMLKDYIEGMHDLKSTQQQRKYKK